MQSRWISQAGMHGDRRPYPVVLITPNPEEIPNFAKEHGLPADDLGALARSPRCRSSSRASSTRSTAAPPGLEQLKKFVILDQETGELTPTLKVKRNVVNDKYADLFDRLYAKG